MAIGPVWEPSMLTYDGTLLPWALVHATLWFGSVIIALIQQGDITKAWPDKFPARDVYAYYMMFTAMAPVLLVIYEIVSMYVGYFMRPPIQGLIFAFGFLGLAFGTASIPYAAAVDGVGLFTFGLFLAASGLGMFVTFHSEFRSTLNKAEKADAGNL